MKVATSNSAVIDWGRVVYLLLASRNIDHIEETKLMPERKVLYQFSARGHDMAQIILGSLINHKHDAVGAYYRSRPMLLTLGLSLEDAISSPMAKSGGFSDGRDIGVVCNLPTKDGPIVLPMSGDVGSQYTPIVGWAQSVVYRRDILGESEYNGAIGVVLGGEGSVATNGFWSSLTIATTLKLPMVFYIEDNGFGISVPGNKQTPGGNIARNLKSFENLTVHDGDGTDPEIATKILSTAVSAARSGRGAQLVRLTVPRLSGHSGQDTQAYKTKELVDKEIASDPFPKFKEYVIANHLSEEKWGLVEKQVEHDVYGALNAALNRPEPESENICRYVFSELGSDGKPEIQLRGGLWAEGHLFPEPSYFPESEPTRINMLTAIRKTLEHELKINPKVVVFGEDVGPKGGVHGATLGLQQEFGEARVFDTSLSEEGIIGRSVGMAICGLMPVPEIQFRKYADPATEQLHNCGTMRWRTANRFAAPLVVRVPGGYAKCGDPWHSVCDEVMFAHSVGWQVAFPSNAEDAVGLLRAALRDNNPTLFFEHRAMLDSPWARRPYPGDGYMLPFGVGAVTIEGTDITVVTWGAMVERCEAAAQASGFSVEVIDLRSISPWDKQLVLDSVKKTRRCLIVHEDTMTAGFGAEIAAVVAKESFLNLDAPVERIAIPDIPVPYNVSLMAAIIPTAEGIAQKIETICRF